MMRCESNIDDRIIAGLIDQFLPPELLVHILSFLTNSELRIASGVNYTWKELINNMILPQRAIKYCESKAKEANFSSSQISECKKQMKRNLLMARNTANACYEIAQEHPNRQTSTILLKSAFNTDAHLQGLINAVQQYLGAGSWMRKLAMLIGFGPVVCDLILYITENKPLHSASKRSLETMLFTLLGLYLDRLPNLISHAYSSIKQNSLNQ